MSHRLPQGRYTGATDDVEATPVELQPIYGGWRVKQTPTHYLDVLAMAFNWRLCTTPKSCPLVYDRSWCYEGRGPASLLAAVAAAHAWDGSDDTEPDGWNKNNQTGQWRPLKMSS